MRNLRAYIVELLLRKKMRIMCFVVDMKIRKRVSVVVQTLAHEPQVLQQGLLSLNVVLGSMAAFHRFMEPPGGSVLLHELADGQDKAADPTLQAQATPLLHKLTAVHAFVSMFTHVCKASQVSNVTRRAVCSDPVEIRVCRVVIT